MKKIPNKIFIVGVGRSGTSLLQSMLDTHSQILCLPENQIFRNIIRKDTQFTDDNKFNMNLLRTKTNVDRLIETESEILNLLNKSNDFITFYELAIQHYIANFNNNIQFVGDKDPRNLDYIDIINQKFKCSKFIHIIRDPREVVLSRTKAEWSKSKPFIYHCLVYNAQLEEYLKLRKSAKKIDIIEIKYEDLINDPETSLQSICSFLDIKFEKEMIKFQRSSQRLVTSSEASWKKETLGPLLKNNDKKWKKELSKLSVITVELFSKIAFKKFGYTRSERASCNIFLNLITFLISSLFIVLYKKMKSR